MRPRPSLLRLVTVGLLLSGTTVAGLAALLDVRGDAGGTDARGPVDAVTVIPSDGTSDGVGYAPWGRDADGDPLGWDACTPIRFVLSSVGAPAHAADDLRAALAMLADASGLDLILVGTTDERPTIDRPLVAREGASWRWSPVLVAWAAPGEGGLPLTRADRGIALPVAVRDGDREAFVTGQVVLNVRRTDVVPGFGDRSDALGALLVHELAHILGLDHVDDPGELMWVDPGSGPVVLGPGDLAGLRAVGAEAGCRAAPEPTVGRGLTVTR